MNKYSEREKQINKALKMNQAKSKELLEENVDNAIIGRVDSSIEDAEAILNSLGYEKQVEEAKQQACELSSGKKLRQQIMLKEWDEIVEEAELKNPFDVNLEDILSKDEYDNALQNIDKVDRDFSKKTSIVNKTDLIFLATATALQVSKTLLFPYVSEKFDYGNKVDVDTRMNHDDVAIIEGQEKAKNSFRDKKLKNNKEGHWLNILTQGVPYDAISGSKELGLNLSGKNHRLHTLGHDPMLGWVFGTANILTDVITLIDFSSYRVSRMPTRITPERIEIDELFIESYETIKGDILNLPTAIFVQAQHYKSDIFTKQGLPIPTLATINEKFASKLYSESYDSLCFARDSKIVGLSYIVSKIIDITIGLVHGIFRDESESKELYEIRTRKILLLSNSIATSSSIIGTCVTKNLKTLDIGSLLSTVSHLFMDIRFITKVKEEFLESEMDSKFKMELEKLDAIYDRL